MPPKRRQNIVTYKNLNVSNKLKKAGVEITATAAELNVVDGVTAGTTTASKALVVDANKALDFLALGAVVPSAAALFFGIGATATRATSAVANKNGVELRIENTATSGDNRGIYNRFYLGGAGGGGESLRTFTTIDDVAAGTAHGAHISLDFNATGSVTGQALAMRGTLHIPDAAMSGGTVAAVQAEIYADGASSDISGTTTHAVWRTVVGGNATGAATVANFMDFSIPAALIGSGAMVDTDITTHTGYAGLRIYLNGTLKYLAVVND